MNLKLPANAVEDHLMNKKAHQPLASRCAVPRGESRRTDENAFVATAALAEGVSGARSARVRELSVHGCYLVMSAPFPKGASLLVRIRTPKEQFQSRAVVVHSTAFGIGMGVEFRDVSAASLAVLQQWLLSGACAQGELAGERESGECEPSHA
jgi:hypothetical protein